jgi:hypothetical protein
MIERSVHALTGSLLYLVITLAAPPAMAGDARPGEAVVAWHVTLAPSWFDPSTAPPRCAAASSPGPAHRK